MEIFLDTIEVKIINEFYEMGILAGVTTNPTLAKRFKMKDDIEMIKEIRSVMRIGEIHVEAFGNNANEIESNAKRIADKSQDENLVFKIPFCKAGVKSVNELRKLNFRTNLHLIFSINQALIASNIKTDYICPLIGRLDDTGHDAIKNIEEIILSYKNCGSHTKVMASSIRNPLHVLNALKVGADVVTIPSKILEQMFYHPLTDIGYELFKKDLDSM